MIRTTRASLTTTIAVCLVSLACASLLPAAVASGAAIAVSYQKESIGEYQKQLAADQIRSVTINKKLRSLRITLNDGRYVLAKYGKKEEPKYAAALQAKHVPVTILTSTEAASQVVKKPVQHKLRYIAGGILIVVIVVVGAVLYIRRKREDE
jgi:hypothetical protein